MQLLTVFALAGVPSACSKANPLLEAERTEGDGGGMIAPSGSADAGSDVAHAPNEPMADRGSETPGDAPLPVIDLDACELYEGTREETFCRTAVACDGESAVAECHEFNGRWRCLCPLGGRVLELNLFGTSAEACDRVIPLCMAGADQLEGQTECRQLPPESKEGSCSLKVSCLHSLQLDDGVLVEREVSRFVVCEEADDAWTCDCGATEQSSLLELREVPAGPDVCRSVKDACESAAFDALGAGDCTQTFQRAQQESCAALYECTSSIEIDGRAVVVSGLQPVDCHLLPSGEWDCACGDDASAERFGLEGGDSATVCDLAHATCTGGS